MVTNPNTVSLCVMLAGEDHQSGVLLSRIVHWYQYAKIKIPNLPGVWVANDHDFWRKEGRLSRDQISRCLKHLHERCLIERTQFWFGRKSILHVRPSLTVTNFLAEATTWPAAEELFASLQTGLTEVSNSAVPGSAILLNSVTSKSAKPSSAHLLKPKYIKTGHLKQHPNGNPATPTKPAYAGAEISEIVQKDCGDGIETSAQNLPTAPLTINSVKKFWLELMVKSFPGVEHALTPKHAGQLALVLQGLGNGVGPGGKTNFTPYATEILEFGVGHWKSIGTNTALNPGTFHDNLGSVVNAWSEFSKKKLQASCLMDTSDTNSDISKFLPMV